MFPAVPLILLCHKHSGRLPMPQNGHVSVSMSRQLVNNSRSLVIEFGLWRCARAGTAWDVIFGNGRQPALEAGFSPRQRFTGGRVGVVAAATAQALRYRKAVRGDRQAGVMMKAPPAAALVVPPPQILREVLVVALDAPAYMRHPRKVGQRRGFGQGGSQYLRGSSLFSGHSMSSHCSGCFRCG